MELGKQTTTVTIIIQFNYDIKMQWVTVGYQPNLLKSEKIVNQLFCFSTQTTGLIFTFDKSIRFLIRKEHNPTSF